MPHVPAVVALITPHPSLAVVKNWRGIVEIALRAAVAVSYSYILTLTSCARVIGYLRNKDYMRVLLK